MAKELPTCSKQIQAFTHAKRLTQKDLMDVGKISRTAANHYFHGEHEPRYSTLQQWGIVFGLNMNWLFYGEGSMFQASFYDNALPQQAETEVLRNQVAHLRLVHDNFIKEPEAPSGRETKEVVLRGQDKEAFEAQIKLIDHVCQALAKNGATQDTIQRAILALVSGAF